MRWVLLLLLLLLISVCLVGGCTGRSRHLYWDTNPSEAGSDLGRETAPKPKDRGVVDGAVDGAPPDGKACSPEDAVTTCNPLAPSVACPSGSACYIVKGKYIDCVCPPGTAAEGSSCKTATDCAPKLTCYSSTGSPPGTCVKLCDPKIPTCKSSETCNQLNNFPKWGYCN